MAKPQKPKDKFVERPSKSRRTAKTWSKESSQKQHYHKQRYGAIRDDEDEFVPVHAVSMTPRLKALQQKQSLNTGALLTGQVVNSTGRSWIVAVRSNEEPSGQTFYDCVTTRSIVSENPRSTLVAVGDVVCFKPDDIRGSLGGLPTGAIMLVKKRHTKLARQAAGNDGIEQVIVSNIDHVVIQMAAADPFYNRRLIDRYLIAAEQGNVKPIICINKLDLMREEFVREDLAVYAEQLAIPVVLVSAKRPNGLEELSALLQNTTSVFSGPSGVGKSTLVNILLGNNIQATSEVSQKTQRGLHTTTFSRLFPLPHGGYIADTPGIREFGMWEVAREELSFFFHDFDEVRHDCKFTPCTHTHEPGCAVKAAVEEGLIDADRYESYLNIFDTLE